MTQSDNQGDHTMVETPNKKPPYFNYRDYSGLPDPDPSKSLSTQGRIATFPAKMMDILSRPDLAHIISWMPHGRSWKVHKPKEFQVKVIPAYFEHSKLSSFIRQTNGWGFRRMVAKGPDQSSYYHEMFLRGKPHLIKLMKRSNHTKGPPSNACSEPDFYKIAVERLLPDAHSEGPIHVLETKMKTNVSRQPHISMKEKNNHSAMSSSGRSASGTTMSGGREPPAMADTGHEPKPNTTYPLRNMDSFPDYEPQSISSMSRFEHAFTGPIDRSQPLEPFPTMHRSRSQASFMDGDHQWTMKDAEQHEWPLHFDDPVDGRLSYDMEPVPLSCDVAVRSVHPVSPAPPRTAVHGELQFYPEDHLFPMALSPLDFW